MEPETKLATSGKPQPRGLYNYFDKYAVTDEFEPAYYSQRTIWIFSILFSAVFGAVLLAINIRDRKGKWMVMLFGVAYTALIIAVLSKLPHNTGLTIGVNAFGAAFMNAYFWNKYIGRETRYRKKPVWKPLLIAALLILPFILLIIYDGGQ